MSIKANIAIVLCSLSTVFIAGQQRVGLGFYNLENLFDTVPSGFYDDRDYTPTGRLKWNTEKYSAKISNIARVIDAMGLDVMTLAEIENEQVVKDLVDDLKDDYCYIHRTTSDSRGMDIAILYKGDRFVPERIEQLDSDSRRELLHVRGTLYEKTIDLIAWHAPSMLNSHDYRLAAMRALKAVADSLLRADPQARVVIMADMNDRPQGRVMKSVFGRIDSKGEYQSGYCSPIVRSGLSGGSYMYEGKWELFDNILLCRPLVEQIEELKGGVFIRDYLVESSIGEAATNIRATFTNSIYRGGFSDHLPVFALWTQ